ncbi:MAG: beta-ketoacyl-[acyl-carrier-protein] synthase family protein [Verrucomicrobia bacterium]|nr:beta-ketoacyl-[acyl-carrier-protein] synthase family protein [Verrucomicrobiota bacterium]
MRRAVITGLGFITSIGNDSATVLRNLRGCVTGVERFEAFDSPDIPVKLAGTVKGFTFGSLHYDEWSYPPEYEISRSQLRTMAPNCVYGFCSTAQAIRDAALPPTMVSHPRTGAMCASAGSMWIAYENLHQLIMHGVQRIQPTSVISSIPGTLNINLVACYKIKGPSLGFASACASSAHALGAATDLIRLDRQDIVFVVGAEDVNTHTSLPFAALRALSLQTDPQKSPCAFDVKRDGFVCTGGACTLVVEELDHALKRGAQIYAEILGWGQSSDGYHVLSPDPTGDGLARAMRLALDDARVSADDVDYINAHATSTPFGDISEIRSIQQVFATGKKPCVSSTKSLTGHGLSLAGAMEAGFCCLALKEKFTPVSAHITELDPECAGVPVVTQPIASHPRILLTNSSGFGGTNVSIAMKAWNGSS